MKPDPRHSPLLALHHVSRAYKVGDEVELAGQRDGKPLTLRAKLGLRPKGDSELAESAAATANPCLRYLTTRLVAPKRSGDSDGAHSFWTPEVPWAKAMTGQPPAGGRPAGTNTAPETSVGEPSMPEVDR